MINELLIIFGIIIVVKVLYNAYYFLLVKKFLKKYEEHIIDQESWYISENKQKIVYVLKKANIKDNSFSNVQPAGFGLITTSTISMFDNMSSLRKDVVQCVIVSLREAKAIFKNRIKEAFNPIYWGEFIFYLPKNILIYLGISGNSLIIKILQIIWWFLVLLSTIIGIFFNIEFMNWILPKLTFYI